MLVKRAVHMYFHRTLMGMGGGVSLLVFLFVGGCVWECPGTESDLSSKLAVCLEITHRHGT